MTEQEIEKKLEASNIEAGKLYEVWDEFCGYVPERWLMIEQLAELASKDDDAEREIFERLGIDQ